MKKLLLTLIVLIACALCFSSCQFINSVIPCNHKETVTDAAVAATCTEAGLTEGKHCAKCGEVIVAQETVAALGHTEIIDEAVAATCTEDGLTAGVHCSVCNATVVAQEVVPASHTYGEWEIITEGDCFTPGEQKRVCSVCSEEEVEKTVALGHSFVQNEETKLFYCEICDARIFAGHLYAAIDVEMNWYDAYKYCDALGGHLVTITSEEEQNVITALIDSRPIPDGSTGWYYWNGLVRNTDGWHWITGEEVVYTNWSSKEPDNDGSLQWLVGMATSRRDRYNEHAKIGQWEDLGQSSKTPFVCEWELDITESEHFFTEWRTVTEVSCFGDGEEGRICTHCGLEETRVVDQLEHNFVFNEAKGITSCEHCGAALYDGHIYLILTDKASWFDAYKNCVNLGGHLVTITSEEEQTFLTTYMNSQAFSSTAWLGAYSDSESWHWVNGEMFEYTNWKSGQPSYSDDAEYYASINYNGFGYWNDLRPLSKYGYICEWEVE